MKNQNTEMTFDLARELLTKAGVSIHCPSAGDDAANAAHKVGNYLLAAAAYFIGAAQCLGHSRAAVMESQSRHEMEIANGRRCSGCGNLIHADGGGCCCFPPAQ